MFCKHCGKEINDSAVICPNCGVATDNYTAVVKPADSSQKFNGFALAGMICAIVGLVGGNYIFCIPSIVGLILSIVGMVKVKEYNSGFGSRSSRAEEYDGARRLYCSSFGLQPYRVDSFNRRFD